MAQVDWQRIRLVVFDVDGTLYDQRRLRRRMLLALAGSALRHPSQAGAIRILLHFRRTRERLAEEEAEGISRLQYERTAAALGIDAERVRREVEEWIERRPLPFLRPCRFPGVARCFERLRESGRSIAVHSDYPAVEKLRALDLRADLAVSAGDAGVDRLKPHPAGLLRILEELAVAPDEALVIGDRDERDGECARRARVAFLQKVSRRPTHPAHFQTYAEMIDTID